MAAKKRRRRRVPKWKKWLRAGVSVLGTGIGIGVATIPMHRGLQLIAAGDFQGGLGAISVDVGAPAPGGTGTFDISKLISTGVAVGVGVGIMSLFKYLARRV